MRLRYGRCYPLHVSKCCYLLNKLEELTSDNQCCKVTYII